MGVSVILKGNFNVSVFCFTSYSHSLECTYPVITLFKCRHADRVPWSIRHLLENEGIFFFFCSTIRIAYFPGNSSVRGKFCVIGDEL